jgi:putative addiction module killer protein
MYPKGYIHAMYTVVVTDTFRKWYEALDDRRARMRIAARLDQMEAGKLGDWKSVGGAVSELRIAYGPGYRLYFTRRGLHVVVMLAGGDKSTQPADIRRAQRLARSLEDGDRT